MTEGTKASIIAGCSKSPDISPAQPWHAKTRLVPSKAAASYHFIRGGGDDPNCARPTRGVRDRALREQGDRSSYPAHYFSILLALAFILLGVSWSTAWAADPPCDKYPIVIQTKCTAIWKSLNQEDGPLISQFGLDQLKRREEGKINAEQHLGENMAFIKQSTEKRLQRLKQRMEKE